MHIHLYFAIASTVTATDLPPRTADLGLAGDFRAMERQLAAAIEAQPGARYVDLQAYADLQVLFGRHEEAEQAYRDSLKAICEDRDRFRIRSCRNAGWQSLFLQRHGAALACFRRVLKDEMSSDELRFESLVGLTLVMFELGQLAASWKCVERMDDIAVSSGDTRWAALAAVMRRDLLMQARLRSQAAILDHVFWQSALAEFQAPTYPTPDNAECEAAIRVFPTLMQRNAFLVQLAAVARGDRDAPVAVMRSMQALAHIGHADYQRGMKLEVALASLCGGRVQLAGQMLETLGDTETNVGRRANWYLDFLYCVAEIARKQGRWNEFETRYRQYALIAVKRARDDAGLICANPLPAGECEQLPAGDDISTRLVGKYRRAYSYLVSHLDQADLTVREIAAHIGVTERALQLTFRNSLGISPGQLIRRLRMEHIHKDLMRSDSKNVLEIAVKWGVRHRSTLAASYRREFNESPSETLMRSAA